jgi:predicted membrane protein
MKTLAGFTVVISILGIISALYVSDNSAWHCAVLKVVLFFLACFSTVFSILFLIWY